MGSFLMHMPGIVNMRYFRPLEVFVMADYAVLLDHLEISMCTLG